MSKRLPPNSWRGLRRVEDMIDRAENLIADAKCLPSDLWLAVVWERTNIPTLGFFWSEGGWSGETRLKPGWFFGESWVSVADVCRPDSEWRKRHPALIAVLIDLRADENAFRRAYNAIHNVTESQEESRAALVDVRRKIARLGAGFAMPVAITTDRKPTRKEARSSFASDPTPITPQDVEDLQRRNAQRGRMVPDLGFLDAESAA